MEQYDLIIIGGGIGGLMAAYRARAKNPSISIAVLEKGRPLSKRSCPLTAKKTDKCAKCASCDIMQGLGGCGAYSDGKFIKSVSYGGWLNRYLGDDRTLEAIEAVDRILVEYGATTDVYLPDDSIKRECMKYDLQLLQAKVKHLGTDGNLRIMTGLIGALSNTVDIRTGIDVMDIDLPAHEVVTDAGVFSYRSLIIAVGRVGSGWFEKWCKKNRLPVENNQVDIGVRVELPRMIWQDISRRIYEPKIVCRTKKYGDTCRMFCFNDGGEVVMENSNGILTVNGHANSDEHKKTENSNFALLSTVNFTQPFQEPIEYAKHVAKISNMVSGGSVIVQRYGDLLDGKRTNPHRLAQSTVRPTLNAVPGDLSLCLPKRQLDNIVETIEAIDKVAPGTANYDTLLYGVEAKYYSVRPRFLNIRFEITENVYAVGDASGVTRGLSQAGAMGLYVGDQVAGQL